MPVITGTSLLNPAYNSQIYRLHYIIYWEDEYEHVLARVPA